MVAELQAYVAGIAISFWQSTHTLALSAVFFGFLALLVKGKDAIEAAKRAKRETSVNLKLFVFDALLFGPVVVTVVQIIRSSVSGSPLELISPQWWDSVPVLLTGTAAVFCGDFVSYWRHRMEHTRLLWPSHAIHHSDTEMTWLTLLRFHPINRLTTMSVDIAVLAAAGFPGWALVLNVIVRHFYGEFIHADFPWTYGPLGRVFVSPAMHRWHHARDVEGSGSNFATVFSVFDQAFGTYHVPGPCNVPLGVNDEIGKGATGQLLYPFVAWSGTLANRLRIRRRGRSIMNENAEAAAGR